MTIRFPNPSRYYDPTRDAVRFWGHNQSMEPSFFVSAAALLQLLTVAGGPTDRARLKETRVIRDGRAFRVDMDAGLKGSAAGRIVLYSNDVVVVGRRKGLTGENLGLTLTVASLVLTGLNIAFLVKQN